jgi:hypothetical protein
MPSRNDVISGTDNQKLMEEIFTDTFETEEIQANTLDENAETGTHAG